MLGWNTADVCSYLLPKLVWIGCNALGYGLSCEVGKKLNYTEPSRFLSTRTGLWHRPVHSTYTCKLMLAPQLIADTLKFALRLDLHRGGNKAVIH